MTESILARLGDRLVAVGLIGFAVFIFVYTADFPAASQPLDPGIDAFPRIVAALIGGLALALLVKPREWEKFPRGFGVLRVVGTIVLITFYYFAIQPLGFVITSAVFLIAHTLLVGVRKPISIIVITLIGSVGLFYLFRNILDVPLPRSGIGGLPF
ncbi:MAG: tripartite tricarboxylate transporter TctB family protein [Micrococcaceae bacterium]